MPDHVLMENLRYVHGAYNTAIMIVFFYMLRLGLKIRQGRKHDNLELTAIKRHRRIGPVLAPMGVMGFILGVIVVFIDKGHAFEFPLHFSNGLLISVLIISTFLISRKIKGLGSPWRTPHFVLGVIIVTLYLFQFMLGLGALL